MSTKRWTEAEDKRILKAVRQGISFTVLKLRGRTYSSMHQRASKLKDGTAATLTPTTVTPKTVRKSAQKGERIPWTAEEDQILREGREKKHPYSEIKLKGRTTGSKRMHWTTLAKAGKSKAGKSKAGKSKAGKSKAGKSKAAKNSWTRAEERQIRKYKKEGVQYVDMKIPGRTDTAIKYHWLNSMNKANKGPRKSSRKPWTPEEEQSLYKARSKKVIYKRIKIAGRSASSLKNHWDINEARLTKEYANGKTSEPTVEAVKAVKAVEAVETVVTDANRPKIGLELKKLCRGYTAHTIPAELGDYCLLLDEAVTAGWLPQDIQADSSILKAPEDHSETEVKTLCISRKTNLVLKARSKVKIWKTKIAVCKPDTSMAKKVAALSGLLSSQIFDKKGKSRPHTFAFLTSAEKG